MPPVQTPPEDPKSALWVALVGVALFGLILILSALQQKGR